jgi:hypothetical protein
LLVVGKPAAAPFGLASNTFVAGVVVVVALITVPTQTLTIRIDIMSRKNAIFLMIQVDLKVGKEKKTRSRWEMGMIGVGCCYLYTHREIGMISNLFYTSL